MSELCIACLLEGKHTKAKWLIDWSDRGFPEWNELLCTEHKRQYAQLQIEFGLDQPNYILLGESNEWAGE